jgi:hypothetical protein
MWSGYWERDGCAMRDPSALVAVVDKNRYGAFFG